MSVSNTSSDPSERIFGGYTYLGNNLPGMGHTPNVDPSEEAENSTNRPCSRQRPGESSGTQPDLLAQYLHHVAASALEKIRPMEAQVFSAKLIRSGVDQSCAGHQASRSLLSKRIETYSASQQETRQGRAQLTADLDRACPTFTDFLVPAHHAIAPGRTPIQNKEIDQKDAQAHALLEKDFHFPKRDILVSCLKDELSKIDLSYPNYFTRKGVVAKISDFFADQVMYSAGIELGVLDIVDEMNEKLKISPSSVEIFSLLITRALERCAVTTNETQNQTEKPQAFSADTIQQDRLGQKKDLLQLDKIPISRSIAKLEYGISTILTSVSEAIKLTDETLGNAASAAAESINKHRPDLTMP
jgi:hypothetical protein